MLYFAIDNVLYRYERTKQSYVSIYSFNKTLNTISVKNNNHKIIAAGTVSASTANTNDYTFYVLEDSGSTAFLVGEFMVEGVVDSGA